jgi:PAS domain S-box-containing protein
VARRGEQGGAEERLAAAEAEAARLRAELDRLRRGDGAGPAEALLSAFMDNSPDAIFVKDANGRYVAANAGFLRSTGRPAAEVIGKTDRDLFLPEVAERFAEEDREVRDSGAPRQFEEKFEYQGRDFTFLTRKFPLPGGRVGGIGTNISDRKESEEALKESEARFRAMADSAPAPVWVTNEEGVEFANRAYLEFAGLPIEKVVGARWVEIVHPDDVAGILARRTEAWESKGPYGFEARFRRADGEWRLLQAICKPRETGTEGFLGYVGLATDITDQRAAEEKLRESETRYRVALSAGSLGAWSWDAASDVVTLSEEAAALFGVPPGPLAKWADLATLIAKEDSARTAEAIARALSDRTDYSVEYRIARPEGGQIWVNTVARPICGPDGAVTGMIGAVGDVTARREVEARLRELNETLEQRVAEEIEGRGEAEEALRQAQKMETLGQLTGGVAHDFNNLLQIVSGNLEIIARNLPADAERLQRATETALRGTERAAILTQRLLAFSRRQPLAPKPVDLNMLVANMSDLLHRTLGETIAVETALAPDLWRIEADPNQLENSILNLAVNARDAMPDGGTLVIETANASLSAGDGAGEHVTLSIRDTGAGMDPATIARAFEPFFTTKDVGKGTGLGLSMVYGFVRQSGGHVAIESEPGRGATVRLSFPRLLGDAVEAGAADTKAAAPAGAGDETILICEDDEDVRAYSVEALRELGYRVLEAADGRAALRLLAENAEGIDLLFTDIVLPGGMSGAAVAEKARAIRPGLPVLFTTGYARDAIVHDGRVDPGVELITKPFTHGHLTARLRALLDGAAPGEG